MEEGLKLYVWENVLYDWSSGMVCILAHDLDECKELLFKKYPNYMSALSEPHKIITKPEAFAVHGGG